MSEQQETQTKSAELATIISPVSIPKSLAEANVWAITLSKTAMGVAAPEALSRVLIGAQMGMDPVSSVQNIYNIQGRYMFHYTVLLARIKLAGYRYKWIETSPIRAAIQFFEKIGDEFEMIGESAVTIEEAKAMGTKNLDKMPKIMLAARAVGIGVRLYCADAFNGIVPYAHDEMEEPSRPTIPKSTRLMAEMDARLKPPAPTEAESSPADDPDVITVDEEFESSLFDAEEVAS